MRPKIKLSYQAGLPPPTAKIDDTKISTNSILAQFPRNNLTQIDAGPVDSSHGNLYTTIIALVLRGLQSTHAKVNGTEEGKGENGDGNGDGNSNGDSRPVGAEQGRERRKARLARLGRAAGKGAKNGARWSGMCKHTGQPTNSDDTD